MGVTSLLSSHTHTCTQHTHIHMHCSQNMRIIITCGACALFPLINIACKKCAPSSVFIHASINVRIGAKRINVYKKLGFVGDTTIVYIIHDWRMKLVWSVSVHTYDVYSFLSVNFLLFASLNALLHNQTYWFIFSWRTMCSVRSCQCLYFYFALAKHHVR